MPSPSKTLLSHLGGDLVAVITPVSITMLLVILVITLSSLPSSSPTPLLSAATLVYAESPADASFTKLAGSLLNAAVFILLITLLTFLLVALYYFNFNAFLSHYMRLSAFFLLFTSSLSLPSSRIDVVTWLVLVANVSVIGAIGVFRGKGGVPIVVNQGCMVVLGVVVAVWFVRLPEWTTWVMLVAMVGYDLVAVLAPVGPLRILVELAQRRGDGLPAFVYETRPMMTTVSARGRGGLIVGVSDERTVEMTDMVSRNHDGRDDNVAEIEVVVDENEDSGGRVGVGREDGEEMTPLVRENVRERRSSSGRGEEERGCNVQEMLPLAEMLGMEDGRGEEDRESESVFTRGTKLGLGDFVFYSVLVGRAAMYDLMTVYACYLAIICGLGCTLILLFVFRRALPALPISIALGVVFYFLTRLLMEPFVVDVSMNLMMF